MNPNLSRLLVGMVMLSVSVKAGASEDVPEYAFAVSQTEQDLGQSRPSVLRESETLMLIKEAESLLFDGKDQEAESKAKEVLAIESQNPRAEFVLRAAQEHAEYTKLIAADATNNPPPVIELPPGTVGERTEAFHSAVSKVMERHGFTWPQYFQRIDRTWVAVCSRPRLKLLVKEGSTSSWEVLQAQIETTPDDRVTLELVAYSWFASGYAVLGKLFTVKIGITRERSEIGRELQAELHRSTDNQKQHELAP